LPWLPPQAALPASPESTARKTAPNANYVPPESSAAKKKAPPAKPAKNVQEAPTQAPKVCLQKSSVQNAHQAKQVAQLVKVQKPPDVQNAMPENTPKIQAKQVAKTAQKALRPKALRIAVRAQPDLF
jgi:hypothetical protein